MNTMLESCSRSEKEIPGNSQGNLEALDVLFSRYRRVLSVVAYRVLGNHTQAEDAVQNCLRAASESLPRFEHEGAFRSWLVRVLIDEAVTILNKRGRGTNGRYGECDCWSTFTLAGSPHTLARFSHAAE